MGNLGLGMEGRVGREAKGNVGDRVGREEDYLVGLSCSSDCLLNVRVGWVQVRAKRVCAIVLWVRARVLRAGTLRV